MPPVAYRDVTAWLLVASHPLSKELRTHVHTTAAAVVPSAVPAVGTVRAVAQPGPYGGPQGWPGQPPMMSQKTNTLAIVAFAMSILCGLPLVPLILGIIALSQIRNRGEKGKGLAVAAIVIHSLAIAFYGVLLVLGLTGALDDTPPKRDTTGQVTGSGSSKVQDIRKGDCFNTGGDLAEYQDEDGGQAGLLGEHRAVRPGSRG